MDDDSKAQLQAVKQRQKDRDEQAAEARQGMLTLDYLQSKPVIVTPPTSRPRGAVKIYGSGVHQNPTRGETPQTEDPGIMGRGHVLPAIKKLLED